MALNVKYHTEMCVTPYYNSIVFATLTYQQGSDAYHRQVSA